MPGGRWLAASNEAARMARYEQGLSDPAMARAEGVTGVAILRWRRKRGLGPNVAPPVVLTPDRPRMTDAFKESCHALLRRGVYGDILAAELGIAPATVKGWCKRTDAAWQSPPRPRHPGGKPLSALSGEKRHRAIDLYMQGLPDQRIAAALGLHVQQVSEWRWALFLPINRMRVTAVDREADNAVYAMLRRAVGSRTASDIADDAVADMWLALADGRLTDDRVTSEGKRFAKRAWSNSSTAFGDRSLDDQLGDEEGYTLLDVLADDSASDWLEEMGATRW